VGQLTDTPLDGVYVITPERIADERGWFVRTLDLAWCRQHELEDSFVQHNQSRSSHGVLRGLHVRTGAGEVKLVRCARGSVVDHIVDVRPWSTTFGQSHRVVLDDEDLLHVYLPRFVAHGFQVVSDEADICYLHSRPYEPGSDISIAWDDPALGLEWPITPPRLSPRDAVAPHLNQLDLESMFDQP
jgi:dTDP-4-dehydrorhamnose 3,5-epimerase